MTASPFDELIDRRNTGSEKWDKYNGRDVIPMWVADMDFRSPPAVIKALQERVDHGVFGYTSATEELTQVIIDRLERMYNWRVKPEWLIWLPGLVCALNACCRAYTEPGEEVITFVPVYPPFLTAPRFSRRECKTCSLRFENGCWTIDFERFKAEISDKTRLLLWCHPHNPVGRAWSRAELEQLADICQKHNLIVCSDEIHCEIVLDEDKHHIPLAA
ncbi:MAG: aminotransferase class I/II-fold pyridoxal phosphate-dependent enzyme, partial [Sedimentisphaerales bacterium]|nr:aminotransferase class I/II-fold pyridoxal phosphate-dependent enzyme [Sedimentisphaerales bacterium]